MTEKVAQRTELRFLLVLLVLAGLASLLIVRSFLSFVFLGALLVYGFFPVHRRVRRKIRHPVVAASLTFALVVLVIVGPLVLLGFLFFHDAVEFARTYDPDELSATIQPFLSSLGVEPEPGENESRPSAAANWIGDKLRNVAASFGRELQESLPHLLLGLLVTGFVLYYGFIDGESFYRWIRLALPLPDPVEDSLFHHVRDVVNAVFIGTLWVAFLSAALGTATFLVFGVPNAVFWGFIMVILGILPVVGAFLVWLPVAAWIYFTGGTAAALTIGLVNGLVGFGYIEHVLRPRLIGRLGRIHPVWVLVGVLGGLEVFGILGFVIGPLVLGIFIALMRNYTEFHPRWVHRRRLGVEPYSHATPASRPRQRGSGRARK